MLLGGGRSCGFFAFAEFRGAILLLRGLIGRRVIGVRLIEVHIVVNAGGCEGFTGQQFDGGGRIAAGNSGERPRLQRHGRDRGHDRSLRGFRRHR